MAQTVQATLKHDLLGNNDQSKMFSFLLDNIEKLEWMNIALNEKLAQQSASAETSAQEIPGDPGPDGDNLEPSICMQILHRVFCSNFGHNHNGALFADQPTFKESQSNSSNRRTKKLEGLERINDLEGYLRSRPEISFMVLKTHICEDQRDVWGRHYLSRILCSCRACVQDDLKRENMMHQLFTEQLRIISPQLKRALRGLGRCRMDGFVTGLNGDPCMSAPYLFLYHHRTAIADTLQKTESEENDHLKLLMDWIDANYGKEYDEADELFKIGMVSQAHLSKLFKPNQVILKKKSNGTVVAYAAHWWPYWKNDELSVRAWSWKFDGFDLTRKRKQLTLTYDTHKNVAITDLEAFPI